MISDEVGTPESELTTEGLRVFLRMYEPGEEAPRYRRKKASKEDVWSGFRMALMATENWVYFRVPPR